MSAARPAVPRLRRVDASTWARAPGPPPSRPMGDEAGPASASGAAALFCRAGTAGGPPAPPPPLAEAYDPWGDAAVEATLDGSPSAPRLRLAVSRSRLCPEFPVFAELCAVSASTGEPPVVALQLGPAPSAATARAWLDAVYRRPLSLELDAALGLWAICDYLGMRAEAPHRGHWWEVELAAWTPVQAWLDAASEDLPARVAEIFAAPRPARLRQGAAHRLPTTAVACAAARHLAAPARLRRLLGDLGLRTAQLDVARIAVAGVGPGAAADAAAAVRQGDVLGLVNWRLLGRDQLAACAALTAGPSAAAVAAELRHWQARDALVAAGRRHREAGPFTLMTVPFDLEPLRTAAFVALRAERLPLAAALFADHVAACEATAAAFESRGRFADARHVAHSIFASRQNAEGLAAACAPAEG